MASLVTDPARAPGAAVLTHLTATARATLHSARRCLRALVTVSIGPYPEQPLGPHRWVHARRAGWRRPSASTPLDALLGDLARR